MHITISLLKFIIRMYELIGFSFTSDQKEYYRCHEKIFNADPKFVTKTKIQCYDDNNKNNENFLDNPLLNFELMQLSLTTIIHVLKKNQIKEYKALQQLYLNILSIYSYDKYVQVILRRYKFFKTLIQIIQSLEPYSINDRKIDNDIYILVFEIFSKLTYKNIKNQEYFIKKNGYRQVEPFSKMQPCQISVIKPLYSILTNCCDQNDYQLIFWCNGFVAQVTKKKNEYVDRLREIVQVKNRSEAQDKDLSSLLAEIEIYLIFLVKASYECGMLFCC